MNTGANVSKLTRSPLGKGLEKRMELISSILENAISGIWNAPSLLRFRDRVNFERSNYIYIVRKKLEPGQPALAKISVVNGTWGRSYSIFSTFDYEEHLEYNDGLVLFVLKDSGSADLYDNKETETRFTSLIQEHIKRWIVIRTKRTKYIYSLDPEQTESLVRNIYTRLPVHEQRNFLTFVRSFSLYPWENVPEEISTDNKVVSIWVKSV